MQILKLQQRYLWITVDRSVQRSITTTAGEKVEENESVPLKSWKEIPGPSSLPVIGPIHHFLPGGLFQSLNGIDLTSKLYDSYGPIVRLDAFLGRPPLLFLFDAESSSQVLRGENRLPLRPGFPSLDYYRTHVKKDRKEGRPRGLITDYGDTWKELRSTVNPVLLQPKTIKLYSSAINEVAEDMIARMKSQRDEKNMVKGNFDQEMNLWSLESIAVIALGCRLGCLDPTLPEDSPAYQLLKCVHDLFILANTLDFKPSLWKIYATSNFKKAMKLSEQQETLSKYFINQAVQELNTKDTTDDEKGILEKLLEINEDFAVIMATDMLFAGADTTGNTMTGTLYLLAMNPVKQQKLREEIRSGAENKPYLKACLKESMRMMPIVSGNLRLTTKEYNLLGYKIPANMQIAFCHQDMSLMEKHFPRAHEYLPERWLVDKNDQLHYRNAHPFAYSPFGFGVRSCIGRRIAELEMETFTAKLVDNFQIEWSGSPPKVEQSSLNYVKGPFNFIFKDIPK